MGNWNAVVGEEESDSVIGKYGLAITTLVFSNPRE